MPGTHNMTMGALIAVVGIAITAGSYALTNGGGFVLAWGAILVGAIQFVVGLGQFLIYQSKSPEKKADHHAKVDIRVLLRSMIAVASADGKLKDGEVVIIQMVSSHIFGEPIDEDTITKLFDQMKRKDFSLYEELEAVAAQVTPDGAEMAIKAAAMVALADGELHKKEEEDLVLMANVMNVNGDRLAQVFGEARETIDTLIADQQEPPTQPMTPPSSDPTAWLEERRKQQPVQHSTA